MKNATKPPFYGGFNPDWRSDNRCRYQVYVTLARFDVAYYSVFKTNRNRLTDFPNLWAYARDLYQIPAFGETTDFQAIKQGYWLGSHAYNPYDILPLGPDVSIWSTLHNRDKQSQV